MVGAAAAACIVAGASARAGASPQPPPGAWRPAEAVAHLLEPPPEGVHPIDEAHRERTRAWRERIERIEGLAERLRRIEREDPGGRRVWLYDGDDVVAFRVDLGSDGTIDQTQYFGPEGLFAIVHRFDGGRRRQVVYWPPGKPHLVEIRDEAAPLRGVWWRTEESPFPSPAPPTP
jgi:hypothetical protein